MRRLSASIIVCLGVGCAPAAPIAPPAPAPSASVVALPTETASAAPSSIASVEPPKRPDPPLPVSGTHTLERLFEGPVDFFITGEKGRLAVISREDGQAVPHRFQNGKWEKIALPKPIPAASLHAGIYFGRDNLPRLMGFRDDGALALVYLHFTGKWEDAKKEIGGMAKLPATPLFGVLGEADPEAVCRIADPADDTHKVGDTCLMKRRSGWKQVDSGLPANAIVRAFNGTGYALHEGGLFEERDKAFVAIGPSGAAPWKSPRGFWIGPDGSAIVAADAALFVLTKGATAWKTEPLPAEARDVIGPIEAATVVVATGVLVRGSSGFERVGDDARDLDRVIVADGATYVAGESGVFSVRAR